VLGVGPVVGDSLVVHAVEVTTDKDGIILCLLASEITAVTGCTPSEHYADLVARFGDPAYARTDVPATPEQKAVLGRLSPDQVTATTLAGEPIATKLAAAPGNGAGIGGLKVGAESGWFAARPSGTDDVYKIYAESFRGPEHLAQIQDEVRGVVSAALKQASGRFGDTEPGRASLAAECALQLGLGHLRAALDIAAPRLGVQLVPRQSATARGAARPWSAYAACRTTSSSPTACRGPANASPTSPPRTCRPPAESGETPRAVPRSSHRGPGRTGRWRYERGTRR